jgi:glycosyltransferase involved in cell wall biosynthesis
VIITFLSPSADHPVGGVIAVFEFANAMARRGDTVHLAHLPSFGLRVAGPDDIGWASFEPSVQHHFLDNVDERVFPPADFVLSGVASLPAAASGLPLVFVMGDPTLLSTTGSVYGPPYPKICIARWLVDRGIELGVPAEQLVHIPLGVRHDIFRVVVPIAQRSEQVAIRYSGFPTKRSGLALRALAIARSRFPRVTVNAFGVSTPPVVLPEWVTFRESVSTDVLVRDIYNASSIYVCTSTTEGFGLPSLEAMACGCALVTVSNGGSDEFAIDGETALVCPSTEPEVVADRIMTLLADDDLRIGLAERGRQYAARFGWDIAGARLETFLRAYGADPSAYQRPVVGELQQ